MSPLILAAEAAPGGSVGTPVPLWWWVAFVALVVVLLFLDLFALHRDDHVIGAREAGIESAGWIAAGLAFGAVIWFFYPAAPQQAATEYLSGYLIEKSLSVDNLFVFVLIFSYFSVPDKYQFRVLFWGIFGALVFRGIFIAIGAVLLARFAWIAYVFGGFLVLTGVRLATQEEIEIHPERNPMLRGLRRVLRVTDDYHGHHFFVRLDGLLWATPLFAVLVVIESTDVLFAVDSIPAIFGITNDPFIVFSSNAFALLGLRALFFLLASAVRRFQYLDTGVALILVLVGIKLVVEQAGWLHLDPWVPLVGIAVILGVSMWLSARHREEEDASEVVEQYRRRDFHEAIDGDETTEGRT